MESTAVLLELKEITDNNIHFAESLRDKSNSELNSRITEGSWSVLECLEHLNLYGNFYLPEISTKINTSKTKRKEQFKSGLLGGYFAKTMLHPAKIKTFKAMNPIYSNLDNSTLKTFMEQQYKTLEILDLAHNVDLNKVKTSISISSFIKLRLGDTLRVVIYHNKRHILQAQRVLNTI